MSTLAMIVAAAPALTAPAPPPLEQAISLSIPSTDGARGAQVTYERWLPARGWSVAASGELRESAIGDYTGVRVGAGVALRHYWRRDAWLSTLPAGNMVGWFYGGGGYLAVDATHDNADHRWLSSALSVGANAVVGYRIAPWRQLAITPSAGLQWQHDFASRIPDWNLAGLIVGLEVGWMF
jgi:hypothetical protein